MCCAALALSFGLLVGVLVYLSGEFYRATELYFLFPVLFCPSTRLGFSLLVLIFGPTMEDARCVLSCAPSLDGFPLEVDVRVDGALFD